MIRLELLVAEKRVGWKKEEKGMLNKNPVVGFSHSCDHGSDEVGEEQEENDDCYDPIISTIVN